jgi:UDP-N-acetyl-D-galactosamine dehydrogenase
LTFNRPGLRSNLHSIRENILSSPSIAIIGLGYVGLPLALAFSRHYSVTAYDLSETRIAELKDGFDRTGEVDASQLKSVKLTLTGDPKDIAGADYFIIQKTARTLNR